MSATNGARAMGGGEEKQQEQAAAATSFASAAVTALEHLHPRSALVPHLERLESIVTDLRALAAAAEKGEEGSTEEGNPRRSQVAGIGSGAAVRVARKAAGQSSPRRRPEDAATAATTKALTTNASSGINDVASTLVLPSVSHPSNDPFGSDEKESLANGEEEDCSPADSGTKVAAPELTRTDLIASVACFGCRRVFPDADLLSECPCFETMNRDESCFRGYEGVDGAVRLCRDCCRKNDIGVKLCHVCEGPVCSNTHPGGCGGGEDCSGNKGGRSRNEWCQQIKCRTCRWPTMKEEAGWLECSCGTVKACPRCRKLPKFSHRNFSRCGSCRGLICDRTELCHLFYACCTTNKCVTCHGRICSGCTREVPDVLKQRYESKDDIYISVLRENCTSCERIEGLKWKVRNLSCGGIDRGPVNGTLLTHERSSDSKQLRQYPDQMPAQQVVLSGQSLLARILDFDGSLAVYHKCYHIVVGIDSMLPHKQYSKSQLSGHKKAAKGIRAGLGTAHLAFVCKTWLSLIVGELGLLEWGKICEREESQMLAFALRTKNDASAPWLDRMQNMAMSNDVAGLSTAYNCSEDDDSPNFVSLKSQSGFGAAVMQYKNDVQALEPKSCPLLPFCSVPANTNRNEWEQDAVTAALAYSAAIAGAADTLQFLDVGRLAVYDDYGPALLSVVVDYACRKPFLRAPLIGVEGLLQVPSSELLRGDPQRLERNDDALHRAAARGHEKLVSLLLDYGYDPSLTSQRATNWRVFRNGTIHTLEELTLPERWAQARGHVVVEEFLRSRRLEYRPDLRDLFSVPLFSGVLSSFFPHRKRQYGFITPDGGQEGLNYAATGKGIFVHISALRKYAAPGRKNSVSSGFPRPGQKLCFTVALDDQERPLAAAVISGEDNSYLDLTIDNGNAAEEAWGNARGYNFEDSSCKRECVNSGYQNESESSWSESESEEEDY